MENVLSTNKEITNYFKNKDMKPKLEFRVFNKETNEMHYQLGDIDCYDDAIRFDFNHFDLIKGINDLIVMQGYEPSSNIKIFEDDLVTAICSFGKNIKKRRICKIIRTNKGMSILVWDGKEWHAYASMDFSSIKVLGNLHENYNLLLTSNHL